MANLSYAELKGLWLQAAKGTKYATNTWASLMAAIAEAESSGDPGATNPTDNNGRQTSWGLWQISNGDHSAPPNWSSPAGNAQLAIGKLNSQGLTAWGTYTSGAYKAFLSDKTTAAAAPAGAGPDAVTTAALAAGAQAQAYCAWSVSSFVPNPSIAGFHPFGSLQGNVCLIAKSQVRALLGVGLLIAGVYVITFGALGIAEAAGLNVAVKVAGAVVGKGGGKAAAAKGKAAPAAAETAAPAATATRQGTLADRRGTSPEFREQYGTAS
jgi:hypothetical protein